MSFSWEGNAYLDKTYLTFSSIENSSISNSAIDMSNLNIINLANPINNLDAANKKYVDNLLINRLNITLTGTTDNLISSNLNGCYQIMIKNQILNGPSAIFTASKNEANQNAHIIRQVASPGITFLTQLKLKWESNNGIYLSKTDNNYNGNYSIKINYLI